MARFNVPAPKPPASLKTRVCLFVNPDTYRRLKCQCMLDGTNVSRWFDEAAALTLAHRALGFTEPVARPRKRKPKPA